ncbi:MAG: hypothetical protein IK117_05610 [Bacteroidales bacterium]|nr:hypothetical protein [Bacteroidales bacterium]
MENTNNNNNRKDFFSSKFFNFWKIILSSAPFALLLSIIFFWYQTYSNEKDVNGLLSNLRQIESSLSTRNIGIYPDYLIYINQFVLSDKGETNMEANLREVASKGKEKYVIFEDMLLYGAFTKDTTSFQEMVVSMKNKDSRSVSLVYYKVGGVMRESNYYRNIRERWIPREYMTDIYMERKNVFSKRRIRGVDSIAYVTDSLYDVFFKKYWDEHLDELKVKIEPMKKHHFYSEKYALPVFEQMDAVKDRHIGKKKIKDIKYTDIQIVYDSCSLILEKYYETCGVNLIPVRNTISMNAWSNGSTAIFAFPSQYGASEIGFISHDEAILNYIEGMLQGILTAQKEEKMENGN